LGEEILSEEERNDILNEYKDTIEEKVKHGSSEEEAVADFGSIEELSREILISTFPLKSYAVFCTILHNQLYPSHSTL